MRRLQPDTVQMLWDVGGSADPHLDRSVIPYLSLLPMSQDELAPSWRATCCRSSSASGEDRPDVVLPFLGRLLDEVEEQAW